MKYTIKRVLASSGFCTVEHFYVYKDSDRLEGYWTRAEARKAINIRKRVDRQCKLVDHSKRDE